MPKPKDRRLRDEKNDRAYDKQKVIAEFTRLAEENMNIIYMSDLYHAIKMERQAFDKMFKKGSADRDKLQALLDRNVDRNKEAIRDRLLNLNQSVGLIALYKILGTDDEREALGVSKRSRNEDKGENNITLTIN